MQERSEQTEMAPDSKKENKYKKTKIHIPASFIASEQEMKDLVQNVRKEREYVKLSRLFTINGQDRKVDVASQYTSPEFYSKTPVNVGDPYGDDGSLIINSEVLDSKAEKTSGKLYKAQIARKISGEAIAQEILSDIAFGVALRLNNMQYTSSIMISDDGTLSVWECSNGGAMNGHRFNLSAEVALPSVAFLAEKIEKGEEITLEFEAKLLSTASAETPRKFTRF